MQQFLSTLVILSLILLFANPIQQWLNNAQYKVVNWSFFMVYAVCFCAFFSVGLAFLSFVYWHKGFLIPWAGLTITTKLMSFSIAIIIYFKDKFHYYRHNQHNKNQYNKISFNKNNKLG